MVGLCADESAEDVLGSSNPWLNRGQELTRLNRLRQYRLYRLVRNSQRTVAGLSGLFLVLVSTVHGYA